MAPRGPKNQTATAGRETRSSTLNAKSSSRGGIQKRRGPTRIDGDGDLDMGASSGPKTGSGRPGPRSANARGGSKAVPTSIRHLGNGDASGAKAGRHGKTRGTTNIPLAFLRIHGLKESKAATNEGGGLPDLIAFLERKATALSTTRPKRHITIKKSYRVGDYVFVGASKEDVEDILKLNTFTFAGSKLEIIESEDGQGHNGNATESKDTQELRAKLQSILGQRYLGATKLLKLDALATDVELVNLGMFDNRERALKTFKGLMAICDSLFKTVKDKQDAIESISLASNSIDDVGQVESVALTFPHLKNLDMSGNQINNMQGLGHWKGKFKHLETIYLTGNPIESSDPNYQSTLLEWFPRLRVVNGTQLRSAEQVAAALLPKAIPQKGPDFRDVNGIGEKFLMEFFTAYDGDRHGLASRLYDEASQFSLAVDTRTIKDSNNTHPALPWSTYIKVSRNLLKITTPNARVQRLFKGVNLINEVWKGLPLTKHPSIKDDTTKYIMDCHPMSGLVDLTGQSRAGVDGLIITIHGEFEEYDQGTETRGLRSFSRTFILGPGQPGKGPIRVVSDMLSLRAYGSLPNVFAAPATQQPSAGSNQQQAMIAELCKQTGMTPQYSEMCLAQVSWDFDKALVIFNEKKSQLPAEAFAGMK